MSNLWEYRHVTWPPTDDNEPEKPRSNKPLHMLYIIGVPGCGKTTLVKRMVKDCRVELVEKPIKHEQYSSKVIQLGWDRDNFGGTDSLHMASQYKVLDWFEDKPFPFVLAEGDRLANAKFFEGCLEIGVKLTIATMVTPEAIVKKRLKARSREVGKKQSSWWLKTRATKVANLTEQYVEEKWLLDGTRPYKELIQQLYTHPVGNQIKRAKKSY